MDSPSSCRGSPEQSARLETRQHQQQQRHHGGVQLRTEADFYRGQNRIRGRHQEQYAPRQPVLGECICYWRVMSTLSFLSYVAGKGCSAEAAAAEANGFTGSTGNLAIRRLCAADGGGAAKQLLLPGATPEHRAEVRSGCACFCLFRVRKLALMPNVCT